MALLTSDHGPFAPRPGKQFGADVVALAALAHCAFFANLSIARFLPLNIPRF